MAKTQLRDLLERAQYQALLAENNRHATAKPYITARFKTLLNGLDFDGLTTCPECGAVMVIDEGPVFLRWICEGNENHSGAARL
ncbi:hypothetical protein LCGC14_1528440 [marine sediment metagenome]|uniref:Uncharacterized protein n=1 Tax=marine sediment metagenome TaxID=412755 RepID=A0A0F9IX04_9ZZZZ